MTRNKIRQALQKEIEKGRMKGEYDGDLWIYYLADDKVWIGTKIFKLHEGR